MTPIDITASAAVKLLKKGKILVYSGAPHGIPDTHKEKLNADLFEFIKS